MKRCLLQVDKLPGVIAKAKQNGAHNVVQLTRKEVFSLEPSLNAAVQGGLLIPDEALVDSWLLPITLAHQARRAGAQVTCLIIDRYSAGIDFSL